MLYGFYLAAMLFVFLIGYAVGRRIGKKEGYAEGLDYSSLKMKEDLLTNSRCPLCNKLY